MRQHPESHSLQSSQSICIQLKVDLSRPLNLRRAANCNKFFSRSCLCLFGVIYYMFSVLYTAEFELHQGEREREKVLFSDFCSLYSQNVAGAQLHIDRCQRKPNVVYSVSSLLAFVPMEFRTEFIEWNALNTEYTPNGFSLTAKRCPVCRTDTQSLCHRLPIPQIEIVFLLHPVYWHLALLAAS